MHKLFTYAQFRIFHSMALRRKMSMWQKHPKSCFIFYIKGVNAVGFLHWICFPKNNNVSLGNAFFPIFFSPEIQRMQKVNNFYSCFFIFPPGVPTSWELKVHFNWKGNMHFVSTFHFFKVIKVKAKTISPLGLSLKLTCQETKAILKLRKVTAAFVYIISLLYM